MRPIKFRAWHKKLKAMFPNVAVKEKDILYDTRWYRKDDVIIMQYTGLKDKNGREIYEGDIVVNPVLGTQVVEWNNELTGFLLFCMTDAEEWEVIGNIFENKELLNNE